jgi:hypothetical protein
MGFFKKRIKTGQGANFESGSRLEEVAVIWEVGEYINMKGSASTVGMAGKLFVEYIRLT